MIAVVDTGPLFAAADADDADHERCVELMQGPRLKLVIPALVVAEATYLVGTRLGAKAEAAFLRGLGTMDVDAPAPEDWPRIAALVQRYADFPLGGTDASVIVTAERLRADVIITLDRRHFGAVRLASGEPPRLAP